MAAAKRKPNQTQESPAGKPAIRKKAKPLKKAGEEACGAQRGAEERAGCTARRPSRVSGNPSDPRAVLAGRGGGWVS